MITYNSVLPLRVLEPKNGNLTCCAANLVNDYGISDNMDSAAVCERSSNGFSMWLESNPNKTISIKLDAGGCFPAGKLLVWNYNRVDETKDYTVCGLKNVRLFYSVDDKSWSELRGEGYPYVLNKASGSESMAATNLAGGGVIDFGGVTLRYIRMDVQPEPGVGNYDTSNEFNNSFGLAKIMLLAGAGIYAEENKAWSELCQHRDGWAGGDGIYSVALNGVDNKNTGSDTFFTFGDTFVGKNAPDGIARTPDTVMVNNSFCMLKGTHPIKENAVFSYAKDGDKPRSVFVPDISMLGKYRKEVFFWMQDGIILGDRYYCIPMLVGEELSNPEGYQFSIEGTALVTVPVINGELKWQEASQQRCDLIYTDKDNIQLVFGGAFFSNTEAAGAPEPDGYIYIYGHKPRMFLHDLYVCRVPAEQFGDCTQYRFYDGNGWSADIAAVAPLCEDVSCELSVSPYFGRLNKGKYIMIYQEYVNSPMISCRFSDTPIGPFSEKMQLYSCPEPEQGRSVYSYNAKGHPHLSEPGSLLVSYNVNACSWDINMRYSNVYSPRFITLHEIAGGVE